MQPESFKNHIIYEKLAQFNNAVTAENAKENLGLENYMFFETALRFINDRLKIALPILLQESELNNLVSEIESGTTQINSFFGSNNHGYITNAINNINSAVSRVRSFPTPLVKGDFNFSTVIATFQKDIAEANKSIEAENKKLKEEMLSMKQQIEDKNNQVKELESELTIKRTEIQTVLDDFHTQFETLISKNTSDFEKEKERFEKEIEIDRKGYEEQFVVDRKTYEEQFVSDQETYTKEYNSLKEQLEKSTSETVATLNTKLEEAKKIVNIVGNVGVTGNYQKIADEQKYTANTFRWISIAIMVLMSSLLIWTIIDLSKQPFDVYKSLLRIVAASLLTYPAIYASRESSKHRLLEIKNRNLELELASLGPFIELLPEDKKQTIKEELVHKYFGRESLNTDEGKMDSEDVSINGLEKILKALLPIIKK